MKLWLLRPVEGHPAWEPWYDKAHGFVVRAETEAEARAFAQPLAGDEKYAHAAYRDADFSDVWLSPEFTTCVELTANGDAGVVIEDRQLA